MYCRDMTSETGEFPGENIAAVIHRSGRNARGWRRIRRHPDNLVVVMMMVMMLVSVFAVESSPASVMAVHPMAVFPMPCDPYPFITGLPIGRPFVVRAIADFDVQIQCIGGGL